MINVRSSLEFDSATYITILLGIKNVARDLHTNFVENDLQVLIGWMSLQNVPILSLSRLTGSVLNDIYGDDFTGPDV